MKNITMQANHCVWVSHYQFVPRFDGKKGRKLEKLTHPRVMYGTVYTLRPVDTSAGFCGWTYDALDRGAPARHYGRPAAVCKSAEHARRVAAYLGDWLWRCLDYGHPVVGWSRVQLGWDGRHRGRYVTIDGVEVEMYGCAGTFTNYGACEGNLAWCEVTGLCQDRRKRCLAVIDLESIRGRDPYVNCVHVIGADFGNNGVYISEVKHVFNERARKVVESYIDEPECERNYRSAIEAEDRACLEQMDEEARFWDAVSEG